MIINIPCFSSIDRIGGLPHVVIGIWHRKLISIGQKAPCLTRQRQRLRKDQKFSCFCFQKWLFQHSIDYILSKSSSFWVLFKFYIKFYDFYHKIKIYNVLYIQNNGLFDTNFEIRLAWPSFRNFSKSNFRVIEIRLWLRQPRWLLLSIENYFQKISRINISLETNLFYIFIAFHNR